MDQALHHIFADAAFIYMSGLIAAALFFVMAGIRAHNESQYEGLLYVALGLFFFGAHFYYMLNLPSTTAIGSAANLSLVWHWLAEIFAPAIITLFLLIGLYNFLVTQVKLGLTKIFFGLSLSAFLYWVGIGWAVDVKGILTLVWTLIWFDVELETAS